jgi:D-psicose/D-tagatose/L-ribulose 3-epimerase
MNKIGFNVLAWSAGMDESLFPIAERLKKIGYDGVELFIGDAPAVNFKAFGDFTKNIGLETTAVMVLSKDENIISEDKKIRENGLSRIKSAIDRCNDLNASVLCGPFHSAFATFDNHEPFEIEYERSAEILHQAGDYAQQAGVLLTPEAINRFECYLCNTMAQLTYLLQKVNHPNVRAMYDTHHANMEEKGIAASIEAISPYLRHFHISENDRGTPGSGHVHWDETFKTLAKINYKGWLTIEAFSRNDPAFANAIGVWREYNDPWDIAGNGFEFIKEMGGKYGL